MKGVVYVKSDFFSIVKKLLFIGKKKKVKTKASLVSIVKSITEKIVYKDPNPLYSN